MSYDLHFTSSQETPPNAADLRAYFEGRPGYQVNEDRVAYENPRTGVYFSFQLVDPAQAEPGEVPIAFNINYFRSGVFALEAEPELKALTETFALEVRDPQREGMGTGPYSSEGFLRGWERGNASAHQACLQAIDAPALFDLPTSVTRGLWRWNFERERYNEQLESTDAPCFVPTMFLMRRVAPPASAFTATVWAQAMPLALPRVDVILTASEPNAPLRLIPWAEVEPLLAPWPRRGADASFEFEGRRTTMGVEHWLIDAPQPALAALLDNAGVVEKVVRLRADQVLDRELVAAARPG